MDWAITVMFFFLTHLFRDNKMTSYWARLEQMADSSIQLRVPLS
jgi:hypothetical protein